MFALCKPLAFVKEDGCVIIGCRFGEGGGPAAAARGLG